MAETLEDERVACTERGYPAGRQGRARRGGREHGGGLGRDRVVGDVQPPRLDNQDRGAARRMPIGPERRIGQAGRLNPLRRRRFHRHVDRQERLDDAKAKIVAPMLGNAACLEAKDISRAPGATRDGGQSNRGHAARPLDPDEGGNSVALGHQVVARDEERRFGAVQCLQIAHEAGPIARQARAGGVLDEVLGEDVVERSGVAGDEDVVDRVVEPAEVAALAIACADAPSVPRGARATRRNSEMTRPVASARTRAMGTIARRIGQAPGRDRTAGPISRRARSKGTCPRLGERSGPRIMPSGVVPTIGKSYPER